MSAPARAAVVLAALLAAGCASDAPDHRAGALVPMPPAWDALAGESAALASIPSWGELFSDPQLDGVVAAALESNRNLEAAAARVERAAAQARIAGADLYPQVAASVDAGRRKQNFIGLPIPGAEGRVLTNTSTSFGTSLNVSWEADVWGRLRAARDAAGADAAAVERDFTAARLSLSGQVAKTWFALGETRAQLDLAAATHRNRIENAERVRRRYQAGLASPVDLRLADSNAAVALSRVELRRRQLDSTARQLDVLLGRYPAGDAEAPATLPDVIAPIPAGVPASILARRPDLQAAERRAAAASARVAQARASLYPQLRLTGSAGTSTRELEQVLDGDFSVWGFAFNLLQPIFQGGRLRAGIDLAEAIEDESVALFAQRILDALAEVESLLFAQDALVRQEEALALAAENARDAQRVAEQRYAAGVADYLLLLEAQRQTFEAESQLLDLRRQRLAARVDLYLALGGDVAAEEEILATEGPASPSESRVTRGTPVPDMEKRPHD